MRTQTAVIASLAALSIASTAPAVTVLNDTFNAEGTGATALAYTGFANFNVTAGDVDLIKSGDFGINCAGGSGLCVDLSGFNAGTLSTKTLYSVAAGQVITLSALFEGRSIPTNATLSLINAGGTVLASTTAALAAGAGFAPFVVSYTPTAAQSFRAVFRSNTAGATGPVLDNVMLDIAAVPEPASWALLIGGFAMTGVAMRRRPRGVVAA